ncbi:hypothetical protein HG530_009309 [Fusarium avenaceum]|nr:hypothetical protein HG530_009309 [Fusarium avenaceum]
MLILRSLGSCPLDIGTDCVTAVNDQVAASGVCAGVGEEVDVGSLELLGVTVAAHGDHAPPELLGLGVDEVGEAGVDVAGGDAVDTGKVAPLVGEGLGHVDAASLGHVVRSLLLGEVGDVARHGGCDDERAVALLLEESADGLGAVGGAVEVDLDNVVPVGGGAVDDTSVGGSTGAEEASVNLAKVLDNLTDEALNVVVVGSVQLVGLGLDAVLLDELLDVLVGALLAGSVGDGDVGAHLGSAAGSLDTHAAGSGSAGDDDDLALKAKEVEDVIMAWHGTAEHKAASHQTAEAAQLTESPAALNKVAEIPLHPQSLVRVVHDLGRCSVRSHILARLPRIRLARLELLVEVDEHHAEDITPSHRHAEHGQHNSVALAVPVVLEVPHTYEESVERKTNDIGSKGEHHDVDLDILDRELETVKDALLGRILICLSDILDHAQLRNLSLLLGEASRVVRQVGQDEGGRNGNSHGDGALDPEQPSPGRVAKNTLHVGQHARADKRGEGVGDQVAAEQNGVSLGQLPARVPLRQDEERTRQEGSLDEAQEESDADHAGKVVYAAGQGRDEAPEEHGGGDVQRGPLDAVDEHVGGHLHEDVADVEDAQAGGVLVVAEVEVLLEALEAGGGHVVAVEVVHDVDEHEEGASRVELALHALLDGLAVLRVHGLGGCYSRLGVRVDAHLGRGDMVVWLHALIRHGVLSVSGDGSSCAILSVVLNKTRQLPSMRKTSLTQRSTEGINTQTTTLLAGHSRSFMNGLGSPV